MLRKTISVGACIGLAASVLIAGGTSPIQAATPSPNSRADIAAGWLANQNPGTAGGPLTSSIIALTTSGVGKTKSQQWLSILESNIGAFVADGPGQAGALAKSIYTVQAQGSNASAFGGNDMPADLNALMVSSGANQGRFQVNSTDYSSGLTQAWAVLGLARTPSGAPADAVTYLIGLQCPNGGFAAAYNSDENWTPGQYHGTCQSNDEVDNDTTSMALQALLAPGVASASGASAAVTKAADYLAGVQNSDGSVSDPWFGPNSNTTGLAGQALRAAGKTTQANKATNWLNSMQLTCANVTSAAAFKQVGAVAYNTEALAKGKKSGISGGDFTQWTMSAQQAIGGMVGAKPLGTASATSQVAGLPAVKCDPLKVKVTKIKKYKNAKARVYFTSPSATVSVGKATSFKYRVRYSGKKWGKSWKTLKASSKSVTLTKAHAKKKKGSNAKHRTVTRWVQIRAANAAGHSQVVQVKVRQKVRVHR